jgi:ankyrin repeat protein
MVEEHWGNELLCLAAGVGCMPIVQRLMTNAEREGELRNELLRENQLEENHSPFDKTRHQSIGQAVLGNHVDIVEYLLGQDGIEAHLRYRNSRGENVLHLALGLCNLEIYRILIPRF